MKHFIRVICVLILISYVFANNDNEEIQSFMETINRMFTLPKEDISDCASRFFLPIATPDSKEVGVGADRHALLGCGLHCLYTKGNLIEPPYKMKLDNIWNVIGDYVNKFASENQEPIKKCIQLTNSDKFILDAIKIQDPQMNDTVIACKLGLVRLFCFAGPDLVI